MATPYDLAQRIKRNGGGARPVEIGKITALKPLTLKIGNAEYDAKHWAVYAPVLAREKEEESEEIVLTDYQGYSSKYKMLTSKKRKAKIEYKVDDLVAVQQMSGDRSFIILGKIERVIEI